MTKLWWLAAGLGFFPVSALSGETVVGNGGGISEQNLMYVFLHLDSYLAACQAAAACAGADGADALRALRALAGRDFSISFSESPECSAGARWAWCGERLVFHRPALYETARMVEIPQAIGLAIEALGAKVVAGEGILARLSERAEAFFVQNSESLFLGMRHLDFPARPRLTAIVRWASDDVVASDLLIQDGLAAHVLTDRVLATLSCADGRRESVVFHSLRQQEAERSGADFQVRASFSVSYSCLGAGQNWATVERSVGMAFRCESAEVCVLKDVRL